ncbi:MAG: hypothetical protein CTY31_11480 [Hyphomicrobium sp.]|nr:MAG: hypothetical protein CTY31_11480 [Hyphomicrobium sp.]
MNQAFFAGKSFTTDWLSPWLDTWTSVFKDRKHLAIDILEIGSFEGRSAVFFLEFFPQSKVICIDTFAGNDEHLDPSSKTFANMSDVEKRFDDNVHAYGPRIKKMKGHSVELLSKLTNEAQTFDVIYVDGDHHATSVYFDACIAWSLLKSDGIMILDDYRWKPEFPDHNRPKVGIDFFLKSISGQYLELHRDHQIIVQKISIAEDIEPSPYTSQSNLTSQSYGPVTIGGRQLDELSAGSVSPPLVSFVLINWNYGRYVGQTINSIKQQDYPFFECLVIDNGSTDNSKEVIETHIKGDDRFKTAYLDQNMGQLGAAIWSLNKIKGGFVTFVDADDVLFANFAATHLQAHLALPRSVAFTSSNMIEINDAGSLLTSLYCHININQSNFQKGFRDASKTLRFSSISDEQYLKIAEVTAYLPRWIRGWPWGPGTANMFRKSMLDLTKIGDGNSVLLRSADGHFNRACHSIAGSAVVDLPLSAYRVHGNNFFAQGESIRDLRNGTPAYHSKSNLDNYDSVAILFERVERFKWLLGDNYWTTVDRLAGTYSHRQRRKYFSTQRGEDIFLQNSVVLRKSLGDKDFVNAVVERNNRDRTNRILHAGFDGKTPFKSRARAMAMRALIIFPNSAKLIKRLKFKK